MRAFIFGHSHMWAVRQALVHAQREESRHLDQNLILCGTTEFPGSLVYANFRTGSLSVNAGLLSALQRAGAKADTDVLVSGVQGNQYNAFALLTDGAPFDVHIPGWPSMPAANVPLLPLMAVKEMMEVELNEFQLFCTRLRSLSYRGFMHLSPPPPIPDNAFIQSKLPPLLSGEPPEVSLADLRLKLWTIQQELSRKIVEGQGGELLAPPVESQDADGFLKPEYWKDSVHANKAYAALQLEQVHSAMLCLQKDKGHQNE